MKWSIVFAFTVFAALNGSTAFAQPKQPPPIKIVDETKFEIKHFIHSIAFSPDGKLLAVGGEDVYLYDTSGEMPKQLTVFKARVGFGIHSMVFSPDGKLLAFGGGDQSVRVWDVEAKKELFQTKDHKGSVRSVTFSPDGKMLATGSDDRTAILWDIGEGGKLIERSVIKAEDKFGGAVKSVVFASKGKVLVTASSNGTFRTYAIGPPVKQTGGSKAKNGFGDVSIRSAPNGQLWAITDHKTVHLINATGVSVGILDGHKEDVSDVAFSPDGKQIASAGRDGTLQVWSVGVKGPRITKERPGKFTSVAWAPGAEGTTDMTLAAGLEDGTVWVMKIGSK